MDRQSWIIFEQGVTKVIIIELFTDLCINRFLCFLLIKFKGINFNKEKMYFFRSS